MSTGIREEVRKLADSLPEDANWEDVLDAIELRLKLNRGMADSAAGRVLTIEELRRRHGLD